MNFEIVIWQLTGACRGLGLSKAKAKQYICWFDLYYTKYETKFAKCHKRLSNQSIAKVIANFESATAEVDVDTELLDEMITRYFSTTFPINCDYSIVHFSMPEVFTNRFYEVNV